MTASLVVLCAGYAAERVASTVVLIRDEGTVIVVDPGMVASRRQILGPMAELGVDPASVTDVVFSHHHQDDTWTERPADGFRLSPSVTLMATPGHTAQDITTLADAEGGLAACTHLW